MEQQSPNQGQARSSWYYDDRFTIKTLGKEKTLYANKDFEIIRPKEQFGIYGVVVGQYRLYQ